jgi:endonuclease/exonuclease/phosphatase family metal-dependent hydrolase
MTTIMTWNLYIGADLEPALAAQNSPELFSAAADIFSVVRKTDFPARARMLATEIAAAGPVLLALQEAAVWYSRPLEGQAGRQTIEYDFVASLLSELSNLGHAYELVVAQAEADLEVAAGDPFNRRFRLIQQDAILVKSSLREQIDLAAPQANHYENALSLTTSYGDRIEVRRGWVSVDVGVESGEFRLVTTHLEAFDPEVRLRQAHELIATGGPLRAGSGSVVLAGDLNSGPDLPIPANRLAYFALVDAGMIDVWANLHPRTAGYTAGFSQTLDDPHASTALRHRVDHVMVRGSISPQAAQLHGIDRLRRPSWPSDHAGLSVSLLISDALSTAAAE